MIFQKNLFLLLYRSFLRFTRFLVHLPDICLLVHFLHCTGPAINLCAAPRAGKRFIRVVLVFHAMACIGKSMSKETGRKGEQTYR